MIASPKVLPPRVEPSHHASKVYYCSQSRMSPDPNAPIHLGQKASSRGRSNSVVVRQQLQDLALSLHSSQERENEALGKLLAGLGHMVPTDDESVNTSLATPSIVGASRRPKAKIDVEMSRSSYDSSSSSHHHEGGISESPVVVRPHQLLQTSPHSTRASSSVEERHSSSVRVLQQHPTRPNCNSNTAALLERSDYYSEEDERRVQAQPTTLMDELVEENDALRREVAKYRERSEAQQDHINRLLMCINKYEATTATPARRHSTHHQQHRQQAAGTPLSEEAFPRYATHTTSSLYRRGTHHDSVRSTRSAVTLPSSTPQPQEGEAYHHHSTPHHSLRATPPNPRHLRHNPLLSESTMELLRMAEMRVADGSSFMSP